MSRKLKGAEALADDRTVESLLGFSADDPIEADVMAEESVLTVPRYANRPDSLQGTQYLGRLGAPRSCATGEFRDPGRSAWALLREERPDEVDGSGARLGRARRLFAHAAAIRHGREGRAVSGPQP